MFITIRHDPQPYHRSDNKMKISYLNTDHIVAINVTDRSITTTFGAFIHVNERDLAKAIDEIGGKHAQS